MGDVELAIAFLVDQLLLAVILGKDPFVALVAAAHMGAVGKAAHIRDVGNGVVGVHQGVIGTDEAHHDQIRSPGDPQVLPYPAEEVCAAKGGCLAKVLGSDLLGEIDLQIGQRPQHRDQPLLELGSSQFLIFHREAEFRQAEYMLKGAALGGFLPAFGGNTANVSSAALQEASERV